MYQFRITSQDPKPPHRHYKTGDLKIVSINRKLIEIKNKGEVIKTILSNFDSVDFISIELKHYKNSYEPYPDFLTINVLLNAASKRGEKFLKEHKLEYKQIPIRTENEKKVAYSLLLFPTRDLIDVKASNAYVKEDGRLATTGFTYFNGEIILKKMSQNLKGIYRLDKLGNVLVCDEQTKNSLIKYGLSGIDFDLLKISK